MVIMHLEFQWFLLLFSSGCICVCRARFFFVLFLLLCNVLTTAARIPPSHRPLPPPPERCAGSVMTTVATRSGMPQLVYRPPFPLTQGVTPVTELSHSVGSSGSAGVSPLDAMDAGLSVLSRGRATDWPRTAGLASVGCAVPDKSDFKTAGIETVRCASLHTVRQICGKSGGGGGGGEKVRFVCKPSLWPMQRDVCAGCVCVFGGGGGIQNYIHSLH